MFNFVYRNRLETKWWYGITGFNFFLFFLVILCGDFGDIQ